VRAAAWDCGETAAVVVVVRDGLENVPLVDDEPGDADFSVDKTMITTTTTIAMLAIAMRGVLLLVCSVEAGIVASLPGVSA
jgi:hypothetical protein